MRKILSLLNKFDIKQRQAFIHKKNYPKVIDASRILLAAEFSKISYGCLFNAGMFTKRLLIILPKNAELYQVNMLGKLLYIYNIYGINGFSYSFNASNLNELYQGIKTRLNEKQELVVKKFLSLCSAYSTYLQKKVNNPKPDINISHYLPVYEPIKSLIGEIPLESI